MEKKLIIREVPETELETPVVEGPITDPVFIKPGTVQEFNEVFSHINEFAELKVTLNKPEEDEAHIYVSKDVTLEDKEVEPLKELPIFVKD